MFPNLQIKYRIIAGFTAVLALMAAVVVMVGSQFAESQKITNLITKELNPHVSSANALAVAVDRWRIGLRTYTLSGDQRSYEEYRSGVAAQRRAMLELRAHPTNSAESKKLEIMESELALMSEDTRNVLTLVQGGKRDKAYQYHLTHIRPTALDIESEASKLAADSIKLEDAATGELNQRSEHLTGTAWGLFSAAAILAVLFIAATVRSISRPARVIASAAEDIVSGDYDKATALAPGIAGQHGAKHPRNELAQIAVAISGMAATLERREKVLAAHATISSVCSSTIDADILLDKTLEELAQHTNSQAAAIYTCEADELSLASVYGISVDDAAQALNNPDGMIAQAARSGKLIVIDDVPDDAKFIIKPGFGEVLPRSIVCVPMIVENRTLAVAVMASLRDYNEDTLALIETAAAEIGTALSNAKQHKDLQNLAEELQVINDQLDAQNEQLQCQSEELQAQSEELQAQNEEIQTQNEELMTQSLEIQERNRELEELTTDLTTRQSITSIALSGLDREAMLSEMLKIVAEALHMDVGVIRLFDEESSTLRGWIGHNMPKDNMINLAIGEGIAGKAAESRQIVSTTDAQTDPIVANPYFNKTGIRTLVGIPLVASEQLYGVVVLGSREAMDIDDHKRQLAIAFAERAVSAIEQAYYYEKLVDAEERARSERERLQMIIDNLPEGVVIVSAPGGYIEMANRTACTLYGVESMPGVPISDHPEVFGLFHVDGNPMPAEELPLNRSIATGETCSANEVLIRRADSTEVTVLCNTAAIQDDRGNVSGAVMVFSDITLIKERELRLEKGYEEEHKVAETLQKAFLPRSLPIVPGYEVADRYIAAAGPSQVGGDFYDLIEFGGGKFGIVIGDVSGKGVSAAVHTAMAKYMLRGIAYEDSEPARVLKRLNSAVTHYVQGEIFITLFYGVLDTKNNALLYANAGHELPLLYDCEEDKCIAMESTGPAVGIIDDGNYNQITIEISDRHTLLLYTDGLSEARKNRELLGREGLESIVSNIGISSAAEMAEGILARVGDYSNGFRDDVALLVIRPD